MAALGELPDNTHPQKGILGMLHPWLALDTTHSTYWKSIANEALLQHNQDADGGPAPLP